MSAAKLAALAAALAALSSPALAAEPMSYAECAANIRSTTQNLEALEERRQRIERAYYRTGQRDWYEKERASWKRDGEELVFRYDQLMAAGCRRYATPKPAEPEGR